MDKGIQTYERALRRALPCGRGTKARLLERWRECACAMDDLPAPTYQQLTASFGPPEEMARVMMADVPQQEQCRYRQTRRRVRTIAAVLIIVALLNLLMWSVYVFQFKQIPVYYTDELEIGDTIIIDEDFIGPTIVLPEPTEAAQ